MATQIGFLTVGVNKNVGMCHRRLLKGRILDFSVVFIIREKPEKLLKTSVKITSKFNDFEPYYFVMVISYLPGINNISYKLHELHLD